MPTNLPRWVVLIALSLSALLQAASGTPPVATQPTTEKTQAAPKPEELLQLAAPVALYPDELLMQVLIAATYPLEVVEAARFVQQNPGLSGDALDQAVADRNWDPSVQSLTAFAQVLDLLQ